MRVNNGLTPQELEAYGISDVHDIVYNPSYDLLYQEELDPSLTGYERGVLTNLGAVAVDTGIFTGRSPKDKYIVRDDTTRDTFWWADKGKGKNDNKPLSPETWQHLKGLVTRQLSGKRLFVVDAFCGANPDTRLSVRFITEVAWQAHFVKNMFIRPSDEELAGFKPDFIVMNGAKCTNPQWKEQGLNSENFVAFPKQRGKSPVASGSSVPVCPAFWAFKRRRTVWSARLLESPSGLSRSITPSTASPRRRSTPRPRGAPLWAGTSTT